MSDALQWLMSERFISQCLRLVLICSEDPQTRAGASDLCHAPAGLSCLTLLGLKNPDFPVIGGALSYEENLLDGQKKWEMAGYKQP